MPRRVAIFDFDGTLFRSPLRPDWWPLDGFWGRLESLSPPFVPGAPGPEWWADGVVGAARAAMADPESKAVLLTGRSEGFAPRITDLLHGHGLRFDESHFGDPSQARTMESKLRVISAIAARIPGLEVVEIWEDRHDHLDAFAACVQGLGLMCVAHPVPRATREVTVDVAELRRAIAGGDADGAT